MSLKRLCILADAYYVCLTHVLCTESTEVMGILLGDTADDGTCRVCAAKVLVRLDKRKDRVEISPQQLLSSTDEAERLSTELDRPVRVVGWYHSHPHITIWPSAVDVATQDAFQMMDASFAGVVFAVFPGGRDGRVETACFQSERDDSGVLKRRDVPLQITPSRTIASHCLRALVRLPEVLQEEEVCSYDRVESATAADELTQMHNQAVLVRNTTQSLGLLTLPLLELLENRLTHNQCRLHRLLAERDSLAANLASRIKSEPVTGTEPETEPEADTEPKLKPKPKLEPETDTEPKLKPKLEPETETEPEPEADTEPKLKPKPEPETDTEPKLKPKLEPEMEPESETEPKPESQTEPEPEPDRNMDPDRPPAGSPGSSRRRRTPASPVKQERRDADKRGRAAPRCSVISAGAAVKPERRDDSSDEWNASSVATGSAADRHPAGSRHTHCGRREATAPSLVGSRSAGKRAREHSVGDEADRDGRAETVRPSQAGRQAVETARRRRPTASVSEDGCDVVRRSTPTTAGSVRAAPSAGRSSGREAVSPIVEVEKLSPKVARDHGCSGGSIERCFPLSRFPLGKSPASFR